MPPWNSQRYRFEGERLSVEHHIIDAAIRFADRIHSINSTLPAIFTLRHLGALSDSNYIYLRTIVRRRFDFYKRVLLKKRVPGRTRHREIHIPDASLLELQQRITVNILAKTRAHHSSYAFHPSSQPVFAATRHCGCRWLLKVDIEDFFHSISEGKVFYAFLELGYPPFFALELARICTAVSPVEFRPDKAKEEPAPEVKEVSFDDEFPFGNPVPVPEGARALASAPANRAQLWSAIDIYANVAEGFLPQGAPTSPMLSNLIMRPIDEKLKDLAKTYRFSYTRYADDLAFSSTQNLTLEKVKRLKAAVLSVLLTAGFKANKRKTVIRSPGARRIVLGILVDGDVPRLAKEYNAALRQHLFYLSSSSHGPSKHAEARNTSVSTLYHHIRGKIAWAERIEPKFGRACLEKFETVVWPPLDASR